MRIIYPRAWPFMTKEAQKAWMESEGKRQIELHNRSVRKFTEYIKTKENQEKESKP